MPSRSKSNVTNATRSTVLTNTTARTVAKKAVLSSHPDGLWSYGKMPKYDAYEVEHQPGGGDPVGTMLVESDLNDLRKRVERLEKKRREIEEHERKEAARVRYLAQWAEETSLHGPSYANDTTGFMRWFWIIIVILLFVLVVNTVNSQIKHWTSETNWGTTVYEESSGATEIEFPSVTICPFNRFKYRTAQRLKITKSLLSAYLSEFNDADSYPIYIERQENTTALNEFLTDQRWNRAFLMHNLSPSCEDTIIAINTRLNLSKDGQIDMKNSTQLCAQTEKDNFEAKYETSRTLGRCIKLKFSPEFVRVKEAGYKKGGISLFLDTLSDQYMPFAYNNYLDFGFIIRIQYALRQVGGRITVSPGFHTWIGVQKRQITWRKPDDFIPINNKPPGCTLSPKMTVLKPSLYGVGACKLDCKLAQIYDECRCSDSALQAEGDIRQCSKRHDGKCTDKAYKIMESGAGKKKLDECKAKCLPVCVQTLADATVSQNRILYDDNQRKELYAWYNKTRPKRAAEVTPATLGLNFCIIDVYYRTMSIMYVEKYKKSSFADLLSQVGGLSGLYTGASLLTIVHALVICFNCSRFHYGRFSKKREAKAHSKILKMYGDKNKF